MLISGNNKWSQILSEDFGMTANTKEGKQRLAWASQYAMVHENVEAKRFGKTGFMFEAQQSPAVNVSNGLFGTPLNTIGMGNPAMPNGVGFTPNGGIGNTGSDFHAANYQVGSGDIPMSTLPLALTIAAQTIAFDLVPVIPATGPWAMLQYFDTVYAGGKDGRFNETILDGKGPGRENKPIYIKIKANDPKQMAELSKVTGIAKLVNKKLTVKGGETAGTTATIEGEYIQNSRIDNGVVIKVNAVYSTDNTATPATTENISIAEAFAIMNTVGVTIASEDTTYSCSLTTATPELVGGNDDHVQEFQNFAEETSEDIDEPMTRAENETGVGNTVGARLFTKMVQMGSYEVTGTVTRQQLQDMPLYGIDVIGKILEQMQNRISQAINNRIMDRLWRLGATNAEIQYNYQNVNLNLSFSTNVSNGNASNDKDEVAIDAGVADAVIKKGQVKTTTADGKQTGMTTANYGGVPLYGIDYSRKNKRFIEIPFIALKDTGSTFNTITTMQRRISSRCLAAANVIANVSRRGRGNYIVTNTQVVTALQDAAGYVVAPMTNTLTQDGSQSLYFAGSICGLNIYVDPYMKWDDTRVLVGKKGNGEEPGVVFMPYILADTVQTIIEGTMAPKLLINSRFAIVDAGFYPEQSYLAFCIDSTDSLI